ncbi:MAG TPA: hypothetical protein VKZ65_06445 [Glycomyces sp.]|nr:hypothetical protein [Glycomyces sp.]
MRLKSFYLALPLSAAFALAACGGNEDAEKTYEAGATDVGGGELIVTDPSETGIPVDLPDTPMTPVPPEGSETPAETPSPTATPAE